MSPTRSSRYDVRVSGRCCCNGRFQEGYDRASMAGDTSSDKANLVILKLIQKISRLLRTSGLTYPRHFDRIEELVAERY